MAWFVHTRILLTAYTYKQAILCFFILDVHSSYEVASTFMEEDPKLINYKQFKILSMDEENKQREAEVKREVQKNLDQP